jgi:hypothetical protein
MTDTKIRTGKTNKEIIHRSAQFAIGQTFKTKVGASTHWHVQNKCWYVDVNYWPKGSFPHYHATYFGFRVNDDDVIED